MLSDKATQATILHTLYTVTWSNCRDSCRECPALDSHVITSFKATARSLLPWGLNCSISKSVHIRQSVCLSCAFSIYISRPRVSWRPIDTKYRKGCRLQSSRIHEISPHLRVAYSRGKDAFIIIRGPRVQATSWHNVLYLLNLTIQRQEKGPTCLH